MKATLSLLLSLLSLGFLFFLTHCEPKKAAPPQEEVPAQKPNILFIMSDDHAIKALSCYGSPYIKTPNLDRIAKAGVRFDKCFVTNSICGPSRATILTSKYAHLNGFIRNDKAFDGSQLTLPKVLQGAGYETGVIGKWHLKSLPTGFDYFRILNDQGQYYNPDIISPSDTVKMNGYATNVITDLTLDWLSTKRDAQKPFFLMYQHKAPHRNWLPDTTYLSLFEDVEFPLPDNFYDDYENRQAAKEQDMSIAKTMQHNYDLKIFPEMEGDDNEDWGKRAWQFELDRMDSAQRTTLLSHYTQKNERFRSEKRNEKEEAAAKYQRYMRDYLRCIKSVDDQVGRVLDYLEENNMLENTILVYTSDQGFYLGEHGWFDKRFMYEESFGTPLVMSFPKKLPQGKMNADLVMNLDFAPALLDLAGVEIPEEMQGESFVPLLTNEEKPIWRDAVYYHYYEYPGFHMVKRHYGVRTERYKLIRFYDNIEAWELYDLEKDPSEMTNLYGKEGYATIQEQLHQKLDSLQKLYKVPEEDKKAS